MRPHLWYRLATAVAIVLGAVGLIVPALGAPAPYPYPYPSPSLSPSPSLCPSASPSPSPSPSPSASPSPSPSPCSCSAVSIEDFVMWDSVPNGGGTGIPVHARFPCAVARMITFTTYDITARGGEDYVEEKRGVLLFPPGVTRTTLRIAVIQDDRPEPPEYFGVRLLSGAQFDDPEALITIRS